MSVELACAVTSSLAAIRDAEKLLGEKADIMIARREQSKPYDGEPLIENMVKALDETGLHPGDRVAMALAIRMAFWIGRTQGREEKRAA